MQVKVDFKSRGEPMSTLDIAEVATWSGLPSSTLRYYEQKGLIQPIGRRGLRREYDRDTLQRLALISLGRIAGFSLEEIGAMFTADGIDIDRDALNQKADELDATIRQLTSVRNGLRHAAACSAPSHLECPKFRRLLRLARGRRETGNSGLGNRA